MGRIISIANQKGGVGKTTTAINLSTVLAKRNKKTLLIDMDPQGNATSGVGIEKNLEKSTYNVLIEENPIEEAILKTDIKNLDICPSTINLAGAEVELVSMMSREMRLKEKLESVKDNYDYILIDTPPSLGALSLNSMAAAVDGIVITSSVDIMSIRGIATFIETTEAIQGQISNHRGVLGILLSLYSERRIVDRSIEDWVKEFLPIPTFDTRIPETSNVKKANSSMLLVSQLDKKMNKAFDDFTAEIIYACENPNELIGSARREKEQN